jgi:hypothetical protein
MNEEKCIFLDDLKIRKEEYKEIVNNFDLLKQEIKIKENIES